MKPAIGAIADALEVSSLVRNGHNHRDAYGIVAERRKIPRENVAANCTTNIGLTTKEFLDLIKKGKLSDYLQKLLSK